MIEEPTYAACEAQREEFRKWHPPTKLLEKVRATFDRYGEYVFVQGFTFLREAFDAAHFGIQRNAALVRLLPQEQGKGDFSAQFGSDLIIPFEVTEADHPGRCRKTEYEKEWLPAALAGRPHSRLDPHLFGDAIELATVVAHACQRKLKKDYDSDVALLVHLNWQCWSGEEQKLYPSLQTATRDAGRRFPAVWVFVDGMYWKFWDKGVAQPLPSIAATALPEDTALHGQAFNGVFGQR